MEIETKLQSINVTNMLKYVVRTGKFDILVPNDNDARGPWIECSDVKVLNENTPFIIKGVNKKSGTFHCGERVILDVKYIEDLMKNILYIANVLNEDTYVVINNIAIIK